MVNFYTNCNCPKLDCFNSQSEKNIGRKLSNYLIIKLFISLNILILSEADMGYRLARDINNSL